jgi:capsular polysaccharide biosynthesis protein
MFFPVISVLQKIPHLQLDVLDFAQLSYIEQVYQMQSTDILIGFHGAGLIQALYLPDRSTVIEMSGGQYSSRQHYYSLCQYLQLSFHRLDVEVINEALPNEDLQEPLDGIYVDPVSLRAFILPIVQEIHTRR